jgi:hypothetical protein
VYSRKIVDDFLGDPVGFDVVLNDGTVRTVAAFRGHGSLRLYRLSRERFWRSVDDFHAVMVYSARVRT